MPRQQGFNLIEIMFALLLLGLVITVSVETSSGDFASYNRMKDNTLARWVAFNQLAVVQTSKGFPAAKRTARRRWGIWCGNGSRKCWQPPTLIYAK